MSISNSTYWVRDRAHWFQTSWIWPLSLPIELYIIACFVFIDNFHIINIQLPAWAAVIFPVIRVESCPMSVIRKSCLSRVMMRQYATRKAFCTLQCFCLLWLPGWTPRKQRFGNFLCAIFFKYGFYFLLN